MSDFRHSIESKLLEFFSLISLPFWKIADLLGTCWLSDTSHVAPIPTEQRGTSSIRAPRLRWRVPCAVPTQTLPSLPRNHPPWDLPGIVDHRWSPLSMVDHGWQVNQLIGWHHLSRKSERTWMGFLDIILFHQFDTQALLIVWERCSCCVARMLKFTTSWRKSLAPSIAFRRNWQLSSLLNCSCIMSLIVRRVCISWYSRLLVPAISVSLQDVQAFRDSSNSLARNQRPKLTSCNDHHIHTHAHTRTRLHHLIERDLPVPEHRNQVYILWDALAEKKVNRTLPGPINSSIWLNEVGIGRQPDFAVQHSSSV